MPRINTEYNTKYHEVAKKKIIAAGLDVAMENGWEAVTLDAIAQNVGVTKPALYSYFENREALLREVVLEMFRNIRIGTETIFSDDDDIHRIIRNLASLIFERQVPYANKGRGLPVGLPQNPKFREEFTNIFDSNQIIISDGLARLKAKGILSQEVEPDSATCMIMAMSMGLRISSHFLGKDSESVKQIWIEAVERLLLIGSDKG
jgi:AcrR family transcriptional regulator